MIGDVIAALHLAPVAESGARLFSAQYPAVLFTSGRRTVAEQAHAMAGHVLKNPHWIGEVYLHGQALQASINSYLAMGYPWTFDAVAQTLYDTLISLPVEDQLKISRHLSGHAFDCAWDADEGDAMAEYAKTLPGVEVVLDNEAGVRLIHVQFHPEPVQPVEV